MQFVAYHLIYPILWLISKLPWRIFYMLSSCIAFLVYYIIRYRRKTVRANLTLAFPEKSTTEIRSIEKKFYTHVCDMFLEMIKSISISKEDIIARYKVVNLEEFHALERQNNNIITMLGHYGSYEWSNAVDLVSINPCVGVYKQVKNKYFDQLARDIRSRLGSRIIPSHRVVKQIIKDKQDGVVCSYGMISDQSPKLNNAKFWTDFMGVKTPIFIGSEVIATKLDLTVLYLHVEKKKRGFYEVRFVPITDDHSSLQKYDVTKKYITLLEAQIREKPEYYLWTHKRWKHGNADIPKDAVVH